ncbi:hypothetical protein TNCV_3364081 [Trichonephila clavipes]|nr:hypothetical protein TNCV_3364081 [Trichonephila clavipes]
MHLPTSKLGSVIKAGSCFNSTNVPAASSVLQSPSSYSFQLQKKKKKFRSFSIPIASWCSSNAFFGAVKPPSLRSSTPAHVTYFLSRFRLAASSSILPLRGVYSDIDFHCHFLSANLGISDSFRWHPLNLIFVSSHFIRNEQRRVTAHRFLTLSSGILIASR